MPATSWMPTIPSVPTLAFWEIRNRPAKPIWLLLYGKTTSRQKALTVTLIPSSRRVHFQAMFTMSERLANSASTSMPTGFGRRITRTLLPKSNIRRWGWTHRARRFIALLTRNIVCWLPDWCFPTRCWVANCLWVVNIPTRIAHPSIRLCQPTSCRMMTVVLQKAWHLHSWHIQEISETWAWRQDWDTSTSTSTTMNMASMCLGKASRTAIGSHPSACRCLWARYRCSWAMLPTSTALPIITCAAAYSMTTATRMKREIHS